MTYKISFCFQFTDFLTDKNIIGVSIESTFNFSGSISSAICFFFMSPIVFGVLLAFELVN